MGWKHVLDVENDRFGFYQSPEIVNGHLLELRMGHRQNERVIAGFFEVRCQAEIILLAASLLLTQGS